MKRQNEVPCCTPCSAPARCMAWSLTPGSKRYCSESLISQLIKWLNFCHIDTKNKTAWKGVVRRMLTTRHCGKQENSKQLTAIKNALHIYHAGRWVAYWNDSMKGLAYDCRSHH